MQVSTADSVRMQKLRQVLNSAVARTLAGVKNTSMLACFTPEFVEKHQDLLVSLHEQVREQYRQHLEAEVEMRYAERRIPEKLAELEQAVRKAQQEKMPLVADPIAHVRAIVMDQKLRERERLLEMLSQAETEVAELRAETMALMQQRDAAFQQLQAANKTVGAAAAQADLLFPA